MHQPMAGIKVVEVGLGLDWDRIIALKVDGAVT
jgi:hypothetical protein